MYRNILIITTLIFLSIKANAQYIHYDPNPLYIPPPVELNYIPDPTTATMNAMMERHNAMIRARASAETSVAIVSEFIITVAKINGQDFSQHYINAKSGIAIYTIGNKDVKYMAIVMAGDNSKSYGEMTTVSSNETPQSQTTYGKTTMLFNWNYINSYDNKTGTSAVTLIKEYRPEGTIFTCHIVVDYSHIIDFGGISTQ